MQDLRKKTSLPVNAMTTDQVLRVALYPRVSSEEQVMHGESLKAQEEALLSHAKENHMKVVKVYKDEGHTARKPALKRPVLLELLEDVRAGKIDRILFTKLDRWTRNVSEFHAIQRVLDEHNVTWQAILEDYNTVTADGRLKLNIMLSVAENESDRLGERVRFVLNSKLMRKEAYFAPSKAPFGYTVQVIDGVKRVIKNPETQPIVEYFFKQLESGSILNAARQTNAEFGLRRQYNLWYRMVRNTVYAGTMHGVDGFCEPYISKQEWDRLNQHDSFYDRTSRAGRTYLFSGLMVCGKCGRRLTAKYVVNRDNIEYYYYRCSRKDDQTCKGVSLSERKIERYLLETTRSSLENYIIDVNVQSKEPKPIKKKNTVEKLKERLRRLNVSYIAENITDEEYIKQAEELKAAIALAKVEEDAAPIKPDVDAIRELLDTDFEEIYEALNREEQKRFWRSIIKAIHILDGQITNIEYRA